MKSLSARGHTWIRPDSKSEYDAVIRAATKNSIQHVLLPPPHYRAFISFHMQRVHLSLEWHSPGGPMPSASLGHAHAERHLLVLLFKSLLSRTRWTYTG